MLMRSKYGGWRVGWSFMFRDPPNTGVLVAFDAHVLGRRDRLHNIPLQQGTRTYSNSHMGATSIGAGKKVDSQPSVHSSQPSHCEPG